MLGGSANGGTPPGPGGRAVFALSPAGVAEGLIEGLALRHAGAFRRDPWWWALALVGCVAAIVPWTLPGMDPNRSSLIGLDQWLGAVLVQPLLEEWLFRGALQGALRRRPAQRRPFHGLTAANLLTSAAFVALHGLHHPPAWALATFLPSLALGWLRDRHDSVWPGVFLHMAFNLEFFAGAALWIR